MIEKSSFQRVISIFFVIQKPEGDDRVVPFSFEMD